MITAKMAAMTRIVLLFAALLALAPQSQAQDFPTRPIRIIVGPSPDTFARIIAEHLQQTWGQPVVVETRPGAGGKIAATAVATAEPDGHTLLFATPSYTLNTAMKAASYDFVNDYEPVALTGIISYALVTHPSVPVKSVQELIALAKAKPGQINCGSAGIGTVPHIACEVLNKSAGINIVHVPFRNVNDAMTGVVGGHVQMFVGVSTTAKAQIASGTVRGLAVTSAQRSQLMPDIPTIAESGFPDFDMPGWGGFMAPAKTPKAIVDKLNQEIMRAVQKPDVKAKFLAVGMETPPILNPGQVGTFIKDDIARWTRYVDMVGLDKLKDGSVPQ